VGTFGGLDGPIYFDSGNRSPTTIDQALADGTNHRVVVPNTVDVGGQTLAVPRQPSISVDGRTLAFHMSRVGSGTGVLMQCTVDTGQVSLLDFGLGSPVGGSAVTWAPDGTQAAFIAEANTTPPTDPFGGRTLSTWLWIVDKNGIRIGLDLPDIGWFVHPPQWSPDGRWIAIGVAARQSLPDPPVEHVWLVDPTDPTNTRVIVDHATALEGDICWHPDATGLAFRHGGAINVAYIDADGRPVGSNSVGGADDHNPVFAPASGRTGHDTLLVRRYEADPLWPVFWLLRGGQSPKRLGAGLHGQSATWGVAPRRLTRIPGDVIEGLRPRRPIDEALAGLRRLWRRLFP